MGGISEAGLCGRDISLSPILLSMRWMDHYDANNLLISFLIMYARFVLVFFFGYIFQGLIHSFELIYYIQSLQKKHTKLINALEGGNRLALIFVEGGTVDGTVLDFDVWAGYIVLESQGVLHPMLVITL